MCGTELVRIGVRCVGAPVLDVHGYVVAAVSFSGTIEQIHPGSRPELSAQAKQAAADIWQHFGASRKSSLLS